MKHLTHAGAIFETDHRQCATLAYHRHGFAFATIVVRGAYAEVRECEPARYRAGAIIVHGEGEEHADHFAADVTCLNVELPRPPAHPGLVVGDRHLQASAHAFARAFYQGSPNLEAGARRFVRALGRCEASARTPPAWLDAAVRQFDWASDEPLERAAGRAGVHPAHFSRAFRRYLGVTPSAYRRRARLLVASEMLLRSTAGLRHVAAACGFCDQSHMTRSFDESLGISPGRYRRIFAG